MDTIQVYNDARAFGLDVGLTMDEAVGYAREVLRRELEDL